MRTGGGGVESHLLAPTELVADKVLLGRFLQEASVEGLNTGRTCYVYVCAYTHVRPCASEVACVLVGMPCDV